MNNKLFIAMPSLDDIKMDTLRVSLEMDENLFDRHGDACVACKEKHFGFSTVVPKVTKKNIRCFWRMLRCSYIYLPCGWQDDRHSCRSFMWAELLGKRVIFEEDGRCR